MGLTAPEKLKQKLIHMATGEVVEGRDAILAKYDELDDDLGEAKSELRSGTNATGLPAAWSRHYESKAVAAQMLDGSWVGWTYWYGGGKHGEPRTMPWVDDAYDVTVTLVQRVVREFSRP